MQEFRHGTIVCSCGYRTSRCDCCPSRVISRPNICLSCQQAMQTPGVVDLAIEALTAEAERIRPSSQCLWPSHPSNQRSGYYLTPDLFLECRDKLSLLLETGCDWYYWARRANLARWMKLDDWRVLRVISPERCSDCKQDVTTGFMSLPAGVLLCPGCKEALDWAREGPAREGS